MAIEPKFLTKARIRLQELIEDARRFLITTYGQSADVFNPAAAYGQILSVLQNLSQLIFFYKQDSISELNMLTATRASSIEGLASLTGHNVTRARSAYGEIEISFAKQETNDIVGGFVFILNYSKVKAIGEGGTGLIYTMFLSGDETRLSTNPRESTRILLREGIIESQVFTGTGLPSQSFSLGVKPNSQIENNYVKVFVNDEQWIEYYSLYDMPRSKKGFIQKTGLNGSVNIFFGNNSFGSSPSAGSVIRVEYLITNGQQGNMKKKTNVAFQFMDSGYDTAGNEIDLNSYYAVQMANDITFGSPAESIEFTRMLAPRQSRNFVLANKDNYITFFERFNLFSIVDVWTTFEDDNLDDDNIIYAMLIPDIKRFLSSDVNYFTASLDAFILTDDMKTKLNNLIEESGQKITNTIISFVDPLIKKYILNVSLGIFSDVDEFLIKSQIIESLSEYFSNIRRRDKIPRSDLISIIENIEGVDWVDVHFIGELNEINKKNNPTSTTEIGLDNIGNILIGRNDVVMIKGGWLDRNDIFYQDVPSDSIPSSVNIYVVERSKITRNDLQNKNLKKTIKLS